MQAKNYLIAIISIVLIVGIVLFISNQKLSFFSTDISGQAAKVTKTVSKNSAVIKTISTKSTNTKTISSTKTATTKQFCGDTTCVDGKHIDCYKNNNGKCECEKCISPKSWEFQKTLTGKKSDVIKQERKISLPKIDTKAYVDVCKTDAMYKTGAPIIDVFLLEYEADIDDESLQNFADFLEVAYCNATDSLIVLNITAKKSNVTDVIYPYNLTNVTYPQNFTDYQPFKDEGYDDNFDEDDIERYGKEWVEKTRNLRYKDLLKEEDYAKFYVYWLSEQSIYADEISENYVYEMIANHLGYSKEKYDLLITLSGGVGDNEGKCCPVIIREPDLHLSVHNEGYMSRTSFIELYSGFNHITTTAIHEIGHYTQAAHACQETYPDNCDECPWKYDVMSYCDSKYINYNSNYGVYLTCTLEFLQDYYIPNAPDGGSVESNIVSYYSCE